MVSAAKAFAAEPPREPLDNLRAIAEDFQWRYVDRKKTDQVIKYCKKSKNYAQAVRRAVEARDKNGKHHNHQSKVDITARRKLGSKMCSKKFVRFVKALLARQDTAPDWALPSRFDAFHDAIDDIKPKGIGPVTVYDVAVRVGAYLGIEPRSVYLHAGVRQGVKALAEALLRLEPNAPDAIALSTRTLDKMIPVSFFPSTWREFKADDIEDMLCTYREVFEEWGR